MSDDKLADAIHRGHRATALLSDALLIEIIDRYEAANVKAWKDAQTTEAREGFWYAVLAADKLRAGLQAVAANGRVAQSDLERLNAAAAAQKEA